MSSREVSSLRVSKLSFLTKFVYLENYKNKFKLKSGNCGIK